MVGTAFAEEAGGAGAEEGMGELCSDLNRFASRSCCIEKPSSGCRPIGGACAGILPAPEIWEVPGAGRGGKLAEAGGGASPGGAIPGGGGGAEPGGPG